MTNFFKTIIFFIVFFAIGITLFNVFDLTKNNTNLKTDNEILMEQVAEYENNLTLTRAELIVAQEEREELVTTVNNYQTEVSELKSQAVIDTAALATAEANLATAEQALEAKDAEIAELKSVEEKYSLICCMASSSSATVGATKLDFSSTDSNAFVAPVSAIENDNYIKVRLNSTVKLSNYTITSYSYTGGFLSGNNSVFCGLIPILQKLDELGIKYFAWNGSFYNDSLSITMNYYGNLYSVDYFLDGYANGTITDDNWFMEFIDPSHTNYDAWQDCSGASLTFTFSSLYCYYDYSNADILADVNSFTVGNKTFTLKSNSMSTAGPTIHWNAPYFLCDSSFESKNVAVRWGSGLSCVKIDTSLDSFCYVDSTVYTVLYEDESYIDRLTFGENAHIGKFYIPNNINPSLIREDIKAIVDEFVELPFTSKDLPNLFR